MLLFALQVYVSIGASISPADISEIPHPLQRHGDPFQPVRNFHRGRFQHLAAGLLEVGELGDLLAIEPDLPAQPPGAQRRRLPVILHEADIVPPRVDPHRFQRFQVDLLRVARIWLEDHLVLVVLLQAVGVFAIAGVIRADGWLHVSHDPGFRSEHAQEGGRVVGSRSHLRVIRLPDQAAAARPEILQVDDKILEGGRFRHGYSVRKGAETKIIPSGKAHPSPSGFVI